MKQELWDVIPADMDTSLSKKSVDPEVDYEDFTEDVSRAAICHATSQRATPKGSFITDRQGAQEESLLGPRTQYQGQGCPSHVPVGRQSVDRGREEDPF
ncbi:hypothetical protein E4U16_001563 [Claviceps sp. LM84 group G4]|nr:hypothetical protein E4U16_001563 [Claviceps sp. LM84 group G4]